MNPSVHPSLLGLFAKLTVSFVGFIAGCVRGCVSDFGVFLRETAPGRFVLVVAQIFWGLVGVVFLVLAALLIETPNIIRQKWRSWFCDPLPPS